MRRSRDEARFNDDGTVTISSPFFDAASRQTGIVKLCTIAVND